MVLDKSNRLVGRQRPAAIPALADAKPRDNVKVTTLPLTIAVAFML
jgi:hypothetical protein